MASSAHQLTPLPPGAAASNDAGQAALELGDSGALTVRSLPTDPLAALERGLLAEEVAAFARAGLRSRFSTIKSANFYLRRRAQKTEVWEADPRVGQFFKLVEDQIAEAINLLDGKLNFAQLLVQQLETVSAARCAALAVAYARIGPVQVVLDVEPRALVADPLELAVALRFLLENAAEAVLGARDGEVAEEAGASSETRRGPGAPPIVLRGASEGSSYFFTVEDDAGAIDDQSTLPALRPFSTTKAGHVGLGLNVAQRVARRHGGALALTSAPTRATLAIPLPQLAPDRGEPRARAAHDPRDWDDDTLQSER